MRFKTFNMVTCAGVALLASLAATDLTSNRLTLAEPSNKTVAGEFLIAREDPVSSGILCRPERVGAVICREVRPANAPAYCICAVTDPGIDSGGSDGGSG